MFPIRNASSSNVTGASLRMVTSSLLRRSVSYPSRMAAAAFGGFSSSTWAYAFSMVPNCASIFWAVFSPTPGSPGTLSDASPIRAFSSMNACGVTPYVSCTSSGE